MFRFRRKPKAVRVYLTEEEASTLLAVLNRGEFLQMKFSLTQCGILQKLKEELTLWDEMLKVSRS